MCDTERGRKALRLSIYIFTIASRVEVNAAIARVIAAYAYLHVYEIKHPQRLEILLGDLLLSLALRLRCPCTGRRTIASDCA